jgi:hypothetical protein
MCHRVTRLRGAEEKCGIERRHDDECHTGEQQISRARRTRSMTTLRSAPMALALGQADAIHTGWMRTAWTNLDAERWRREHAERDTNDPALGIIVPESDSEACSGSTQILHSAVARPRCTCTLHP